MVTAGSLLPRLLHESIGYRSSMKQEVASLQFHELNDHNYTEIE